MNEEDGSNVKDDENMNAKYTWSAKLNYLAFDLGAESGRAILGRFDGDRLSLNEVHRFPNNPVRLPDGLHWDILRLWGEIVTAIGKAVKEADGALAGIGLDTWGVDFGLLDRHGKLIENPYHYRDDRTDGMVDAAFRRVPQKDIFDQTGIQFMQLNSLYQLLAMVEQRSPSLELAATFLTIPDLLNYWLTGRAVSEFTIATTTQCYDPRRGAWATPMLAALGIPTAIFAEVIKPGTIVGPLLPSLATATAAPDTPVIAPACHDTGSAVVAVPAESGRFAWISSGTWSVLGAEVGEPAITPDSLAYNFTNEGGVEGTFRLCKNIMGLWLVQECRRTWAAQGDVFSYDQLTEMAAAARPFVCIVNPDHHDFLKPGDMPARIRAYAIRTGQVVPDSKGEVVRSVLEGLALQYRLVLERTEALVGHRLEPVYIVGGGTKNHLLSQFAADATGRAVFTGPVEATALGNILMQAVATGTLGSLAEARTVVRNSSVILTYTPGDRAGWDEGYARLQRLVGLAQLR